MKKTNRDFANDIEDALLDGLLDRVIYLYKQKFSKKIYIDEIHYVLRDEEQLPNEEALKDELDVVKVLRLIAFSPEDIKNNFNKSDRLIISYAHELIQGLRKPNSHNSRKNLRQLDDDRIRRLADTAKLLLTSIKGSKARNAIEKVDEVLLQLSSRKFGEPGADFGSQYSNTKSGLKGEPNKVVTDNPVPPIDLNEPQLDAPDIEEETAITEGMEGNILYELTEPTGEAVTSRDAATTGNVEGREDSRDYINRRYAPDDYSETPAQVVESELQRLREEDTRENKANSDFDKPKRSKRKRSKRKRPNIKLPKSKQRTASNVNQRNRPLWAMNINSNNQQVTYERNSKDSDSEIQNRNLFILVAIISILIIGPLMPELLQGNLSAWLFLIFIIPVSYMAYKRWLDHRENLRRMEIESQRITLFQRVRGWFGR